MTPVKIHPTIVKSRSFGEFEILFQYVNEEPALVVRSSRFLHTRRRAWVILQDVAWKYVDPEDVTHSEYMVRATHRMGEMLGLGTDLQTRFRLAEGIVECLEDLINMKPLKKQYDDIYADVTGKVHVGGETFNIEAEIENQLNEVG